MTTFKCTVTPEEIYGPKWQDIIPKFSPDYDIEFKMAKKGDTIVNSNLACFPDPTDTFTYEISTRPLFVLTPKIKFEPLIVKIQDIYPPTSYADIITTIKRHKYKYHIGFTKKGCMYFPKDYNISTGYDKLICADIFDVGYPRLIVENF